MSDMRDPDSVTISPLRRNALRVVVAALVLLAPPATAIAAGPAAAVSFDEQHIEFAPGTDNATRTGRVDAASSDRWILNARAGQLMDLTVDSADDNTVFSVFAPDRTVLATIASNTPEADTFWEGRLPVDGDYQIEVASLGGGAYYGLKVWIDAGYRDPLGLVQRITFAAGASSGVVGGAVIRATADTWLVDAQAGQLMQVTVDSPQGNTTFDIVNPDGSGATGPDLRTTWSGTLPQTGDYLIAVAPTAGNASYTMTVTITGGPVQAATPAPAPAPAPPPAPTPGTSVRRVSFPAGSDHAEIVDSLTPDVTHTFVLGASAGQTITVLIDSNVGSITTSGFDPSGEPLWLDEHEISVEGIPANGDYEVVVTNYAGLEGTYDLWIYID